MTKRLAIIPARGGSKRIKNKNLKNFFGKPLIYYPIHAAQKSKIFDKIHVSSDSIKILKYSKKLKTSSDFKRPSKLANDKVGLKRVLKYVVESYARKGLEFDEVWLLYASNPFITYSIIQKCKKKFDKIKKNKDGSLITVTKYNYPVEWAQKINKNDILSPINKKDILKRSQDIRNLFCDAGMINVYPSRIFKKNLKAKYFAFKIPNYSSIDIDDYEDLNLAKKIFSNKND